MSEPNPSGTSWGDASSTAERASGAELGQAEAKSQSEPTPAWTTDSWRTSLLEATPEFEPTGFQRFVNALKGFIQLHEPDPEAQERALTQALEEMSTPEFASWITPLMGPTTATAAIIRGDNPFEAARTQAGYSEVIGYDEEGNPIQGLGWEHNDVAAELSERGVHPVLAMAIDMALVPDPTGVAPGRIMDIIPLLGLIGPVGLRAMARHGKNLQFIPPSFFDAMSIETAGLRRTPAQQTRFAQNLAEDPGGLRNAVVLGVDVERGRIYILDGHHRMTAAQQLDRPVPVVAYRTSAEQWLDPDDLDKLGLPIPEDALARLRARFPELPRDIDLIDGFPGPWERRPSEINPAELGFPVYDTETLMAIGRDHADEALSYLTEEDLASMSEVLHGVARGQFDNATVVSRAPEAVPDYTDAIRRGATERWMHLLSTNSPDFGLIPDDPRLYTQYMIDKHGWDEGLRLISEDTGLTPEQIMYMHGQWEGTRAGMLDEMHAGGILARSPDMPTEPPYPLGEDPRLIGDIPPGELEGLADEGAVIARRADMKTDPADVLDWEPEMGETGFSFGEMAQDAAGGNSSLAYSELEKINEGIASTKQALLEQGATPALLAEAEYWMNAAGRFEQANYALRLLPTFMGRRVMEDLYVARSTLNDLYRKASGLPPVDRATGPRVLGEQLDDVPDVAVNRAPDTPVEVSFNTGNPNWDIRMTTLTTNMQSILDDLEAGRTVDPARAGELFAEAQDLVSNITGVDADAWAARGDDVDDALILLNEYMNVLRRIDPLDGGGGPVPPTPRGPRGGPDPDVPPGSIVIDGPEDIGPSAFNPYQADPDPRPLHVQWESLAPGLGEEFTSLGDERPRHLMRFVDGVLRGTVDPSRVTPEYMADILALRDRFQALYDVGALSVGPKQHGSFADSVARLEIALQSIREFLEFMARRG